MTEPEATYTPGRVVKYNDPYARISDQIADLRREMMGETAIMVEMFTELCDALRIIAVIVADAPQTPGIVEIRQVIAKLAEREP